jgi:oligoendopeptidase F
MSTTAQSEFPRQFVTPGVRLCEWTEIEPYYRQLVERPVGSVAEFERWLFDASELESVIGEERSQRYTAMTCQTNDAERKAAFLHFIEKIDPQCEPWQHKLRLRYVELAGQYELPAARYEVLTRSMRNAIAIFRDENIPLQTEDAKLGQQYQEITGAMTVSFRGQELTMQQAARYLEEPDRATREEAWRAYNDRYLQDAVRLDALYDQMVRVRDRMARNADCPDYRAYAFKAKERFDYTPDDCLRFHDAIEQVVVPAVNALAAQRREKLGLPALRPWDLEVDPDGRPPLRPFERVDDLVAGCSRIFHKVNTDLGRDFDRMRSEGLLDLDSRKGKAPGGYQAVYAERRMPFIFMNAVGTEGDVRTLLHEGGHAFHTFACRQEPLLPYRHSPMEFAEVASMGMECLGLPYLDEFFGPDTPRARERFFSKIVQFLPWMARVDAFQHYVYTNVGHDPERRKNEWQKLTQRFAPHIDYSGLEPFDRHSWHQKLHFFEVPFYYIEYGIAQLGALQVWMNSRRDYAQAVAAYRHALALGGSRPLPELFAAAHLKWDFSVATLKPLIAAAMEEIAKARA